MSNFCRVCLYYYLFPRYTFSMNAVFSGLVLPSSGYLAGYFPRLFAWGQTLHLFRLIHFPNMKVGQGRGCSPVLKRYMLDFASGFMWMWKLILKKPLAICMPNCSHLGPCTWPLATCLVKYLRIWVLCACRTSLCQDRVWQLCRTTEHASWGFCYVLALTAQCLSSVCSSFGRMGQL